MTARLILICHASTEAVRHARFPADEPLEERGAATAAAFAGRLPSAERWLTSPELRTRQTAAALGLEASPQSLLRECDYGGWSGCSFEDVRARHPEGIAAWLHDPAAAPHGGESILSLMRRVAEWLAGEGAGDHRSIVVTHASIIRAAILGAIDAPAHSFWRVDIAPLSMTRLNGTAGRWTLAAAGCRTPGKS